MRALPKNAGQGHIFARKNSEEHRNHMVTMDKHVKLHTQDWKNVVVCNMHPFPVQQHFGDAGLVTIRPCGEGEPYRAHTIDMYRITKKDKGNGEYEPIEILPVEIAQELERKYTTQGGVFWFYADEPVPVDKLRSAGERQLAYYRALVRKGKDEWSRYHSNARLSDAMRGAARYLAKLGEVNLNDLEWVEKIKMPICAQCGEDHKPEAKVCKHCEYPIDLAWVRAHRPDLVERFHLAPANADDYTAVEDVPADEGMTADDAKLLGGN